MRRPPFRARRSLAPRTYRSPAERREYSVAAGLVAGLQGAIAVSLVVSALQTYRMWQHGVAYLPGEIARITPVALGLGAAIAAAATARSLRTLRAIRRTPVDAGRPAGEPGRDS